MNPAPSSGTPAASQVAAATSGAPAIDEAKVADLMSKVQADPKDVATLMALADEFYAGGQFETSATWLDKLLAIDPEHIQGLLARGAVYFNLNDLRQRRVDLEEGRRPRARQRRGPLRPGLPLPEPAANPDWAGVQAEWNKVDRARPELPAGPDGAGRTSSQLAGHPWCPGGSPGQRGPGAPPRRHPAPPRLPRPPPRPRAPYRDRARQRPRHRDRLHRRPRVVRVPLLPATRAGLHLVHGGRDR